MVKERRYVFDVGDISSLVFTCQNCKQEVVYPLDSDYKPHNRCQSCGEDLLTPTIVDGIDPNITLLINIRRILKLADPKVRLRFVVPYTNRGTDA